MPQPAAASPPRPPVRTGRLLVASAALLLAALLLAVLLIAAGPRPSLAAGGWGNDLSPGDSAKGSTGSWFLQSGANYSRSGERGEERGHVGFHGLAGALFGGTGSFQTILGFAYDEMSATVRSEPIYMPDERRGDTTRRSELVRSYSGRLAFRFFPLGGTAGRVHPVSYTHLTLPTS
ncbi:MAG: hypothetical protein QUU85_13395, partial [Candidatus Eisenbacteria bacterium]|nr:hypothetical protein [Candidatus Eisenbacteria bacterium]